MKQKQSQSFEIRQEFEFRYGIVRQEKEKKNTFIWQKFKESINSIKTYLGSNNGSLSRNSISKIRNYSRGKDGGD